MALTPKKKEDWKTLRQNFAITNAASGGDQSPTRVILREGNRRSLTNKDEDPEDIGRLLGMMEERLRRRKINRKAPKSINITPYEKRLKGLFGSDD
jgi:hypothetical protein